MENITINLGHYLIFALILGILTYLTISIPHHHRRRQREVLINRSVRELLASQKHPMPAGMVLSRTRQHISDVTDAEIQKSLNFLTQSDGRFRRRKSKSNDWLVWQYNG